jgi:hypothetical protein
MSLLSVTDLPDIRHFKLYADCFDLEKRAEVKLTGLLQATNSGHLIIGVPTALVRGVFDAMHEPGISLPSAVDGGLLRAGIVVMTPKELESVGGANKITERGKPFNYTLGSVVESPAAGWPGVSTCWHLKVNSPDLSKLRKTYGLSAKVQGDSDFSIVVACRKTGVLSSSAVSKVTEQKTAPVPDWSLLD